MEDIHRAFLFDIDGVLNEPQQPVGAEMRRRLEQLAFHHHVYFVTGNGFTKSIDMLGLDFRAPGFKGIFCNNADELRSVTGRLLWRDEVTPPLPQIQGHLDSWSESDDRNNSIEWRSPRFVNFSQIGRFATKEQRQSHDASWRNEFIAEIKHWFGVEAVIGGQVSVDIYSKGADKSRAGRWLVDLGYKFVFIGDKTAPGGNDYPLFTFCQTTLNIGLTTTGPAHTMELIEGYAK